ncbi:uncharacterized protein M6B38_354830 [Iris pallida]|uniref:PHD-type domain-containing protein n=1 Tax=Iris pallida TaxID=29817 RepID=A0AAX6GPP3_IRIPA|nr:uncharacterized protein M6B38_354830 [Iris pallida]
MKKKKKSRDTMAGQPRNLRSGAKRAPPPPSAGDGSIAAAKRSRSEPSTTSESNGRYQLRKSNENGSRAGGGRGGSAAAAADVPRVLPSTKKVSGVRRTKEEPKPRKRGRPPKSSKALILVVKKKKKKKREEVTGEGKASILLAKKKKKKMKKNENMKKSEKVPGEREAEGRLALKQRISDQIKSLLLKAGWTIDLRPRIGSNYMDAVYLPPAPYKGSFWSVTKAYQVYLEHRNSCSSVSDPIPEDLLTLLNRQRNPEVRRRRRIGDKIQRKRGRKAKGGANVGKKKRKRCALLVRKTNEASDYVPYPWKRTVLSWMIDSGIVTVDGKVNYVNKKKKSLMEGWITREGIRCGCCSNIVTPLEFEAHAGSKMCRPYENIIEEEGGLSLLQCQTNAWEKQAETERKGFWEVDVGEDDPSDDTCCICADGGDLVCCDGCPSTFHLNCLDLEMLPPDDWYCRNCTCKFCGLISDAASEEDDADDDDDTVSALLSCSQCEQKFHQDCVPDADAISVGSGSLFCGQSCKMVFKQLQKLLGIKNDLEEGFSWTLIRRIDDASGTVSECNSKIAVALGYG